MTGPRVDEVAHASTSRILVVDDESAICSLIRDVLVHSGYQVDTAKDGAAAWEALRRKQYDLLITDNQMPKITGLELVRYLRSASLAIPVILISGYLPKQAKALTASLRITATLTKPFGVLELLKTVKKALGVDKHLTKRARHGCEPKRQRLT